MSDPDKDRYLALVAARKSQTPQQRAQQVESERKRRAQWERNATPQQRDAHWRDFMLDQKIDGRRNGDDEA